MRIDIQHSSHFDEDEKRLVERFRRARAFAGVAVIGGIALVAFTAAPPSVDGELASLSAASQTVAVPRDGSLMDLEHGRG